MTQARSGAQARSSGLLLRAVAASLKRQVIAEWRAGPIYPLTLSGAAPDGLAAAPRDFRPPDPAQGRALLSGRLNLAGSTLEIGQGGDPWDTTSPSRRFAVELHRFAWLPDLLAVADPRLTDRATREALRLTLDWLEMFADVTPFSWGAEVVERRVFNLACGLRRLFTLASEVERQRLLDSLARQTRHLLRLEEGPARAAERAVAASIAAAALEGKAAASLLSRGQARTMRALKAGVLPDGGLRTRSPEQAVELLFDLLTFDDALVQRGLPAPGEISRAIDRLTGAVRFFTLSDGRLGAFQGGASSDPDRVEAALAHDDGERPVYGYAPHSGYHRLAGRSVQVLMDAAPPASEGWSLAACGQPAALEIVCGTDRLIVNAGWSPAAQGPQALRLAAAASTLSLGEAAAGAPLTGFRAHALGARLVGGASRMDARRDENETGVWLEVTHDGWAGDFGVLHERKLFLDLALDELRGEDHLCPVSPGAERRRLDPYAIRFHLAPDVKVSLARDQRSALLRGPSNRGWWLRNDAPEVSLEPSVHFEHGLPRRTMQIVLRGQVGLNGEARVRWKLAPVDPNEIPVSRPAQERRS
jgi:uncharacterized heparinase superfamily protein